MPRQGLKQPSKKLFPHETETLRGVTDFTIEEKKLLLYRNTSRHPDEWYSLYWKHEQNPLQHNMTHLEVFNTLHDILKKKP